MTDADPHAVPLSPEEGQQLQTLLAEFDRSWSAERLAAVLAQLPRDSRLRFPALVEMVKIDLQRRWQRGLQVTIETYLLLYPELGTADTVALDLLLAEHEVRRQHRAPVPLADLLRRFPAHAVELRRRLEPATASETILRGPSAPDTILRARTVAPQPSDSASAAGPSEAPPAVEPSLASPESPDQLPDPFGKFRIVRKLGIGGMGTVYEARDTHLDRRVALKVPRFGPDAGPELMARFQREARAAANIFHPNICTVYETGAINGIHYLAMAYIDGRPLPELWADGQPMPPRQAAAILYKLALAMDEVHRCGIVHRDLKPMNILIDKRGEPVIVDFGLARQITQNVYMTQRGASLGTPAYMAPEQVAGDIDKVGPACDVYSIGVILYELLAGRLPFDSAVEMIASQVLQREPPPPSTYRADFDLRLEAICMKAMSYRIENRYRTMGELAQALADFLDDRKPPVPPPAEPKEVLQRPTPDTSQLQPEDNATVAPWREEVPFGQPASESLVALPADGDYPPTQKDDSALTVLPASDDCLAFPAEESSLTPAQKEGAAAVPVTEPAGENATLPLDDEALMVQPASWTAKPPVPLAPSKEPIEVVPEAWPDSPWEDDIREALREQPAPPPDNRQRLVAAGIIAACVFLGLAIGGGLLYYNLTKDSDPTRPPSTKKAQTGGGTDEGPAQARERLRQGVEALGRKAYDQAIADVTEAIRLDPKDADYLTFRANAYEKTGDNERAKADRETAARLKSG
jgi:serine/threonine protein kinase